MSRYIIFLSILFFPSIFCSSFLSYSTVPTYNPVLGKKFWNLCVASYCSISRVQKWDLGFITEMFPKMTDITVIQNSTRNAFGFTAYNPDSDEVVMVFRGTEITSIKNWIDDIDTFFTDYDKCEGCKVHEGFYRTYLELQSGILDSVGKLFKKYPNSKKVVTGHSLGGVLAVHASVDIINKFGLIDEYYTYGSPRAGNSNFASWLNKKGIGSFNSRITHNRDPVPHLPLLAMGFIHIDTEVFYTDSDNFIVCNKGEDNNCSNRNYLNINVLDHLSYMGYNMVPFMLECNL